MLFERDKAIEITTEYIKAWGPGREMAVEIVDAIAALPPVITDAMVDAAEAEYKQWCIAVDWDATRAALKAALSASEET